MKQKEAIELQTLLFALLHRGVVVINLGHVFYSQHELDGFGLAVKVQIKV